MLGTAVFSARYGMTPSRNNRGVAHENGSIESGVRIDLHAGLLRHLPVARCPRRKDDNQRGGIVGASRMNRGLAAGADTARHHS